MKKSDSLTIFPGLLGLALLTVLLVACDRAPEAGSEAVSRTVALAADSTPAAETCSAPGTGAAANFQILPYFTALSHEGFTMMFQLQPGKTATVQLSPTADGICDLSGFTGGGITLSVSSVTTHTVPFFDASFVPPDLYAAPYSVASSTSDRTYCYKVDIGDDTYWDDTAKVTIPGTGSDAWAFYLYGDTRAPEHDGVNVHQKVIEAMAGDYENALLTESAIPYFVVNTGDYALHGCSGDRWCDEYFNPAHQILKSLPLMTAPGNHAYEDGNGSTASQNCGSSHSSHDCVSHFAPYYYAYFAPNYTTSTPAYDFSIRNASFVSLELIHGSTLCSLDPSDCSGSGDSCGFNWLSNTLTTMRGNGGTDHIFPFYHAPMITAPGNTSEHDSSSLQVRKLEPLFANASSTGPRVAAIFSGHDHYYERSTSMKNLCWYGDSGCNTNHQHYCYTTSGTLWPTICWDHDTNEDDQGITYTVMGGGGASGYQAQDPANWLAASSSGWPSRSGHYDAFGFAKITIDGGTATMEVFQLDPNDNYQSAPYETVTLRQPKS